MFAEVATYIHAQHNSTFHHSRLVSVGVMDENNLESPILSWQDPRPHNTPLDSLGLTALGSGVFFKYRDGKKRKS